MGIPRWVWLTLAVIILGGLLAVAYYVLTSPNVAIFYTDLG